MKSLTTPMIKIADNLSLPIELVTQTVAIIAKRRAGKSYTARRVAEQLFEAHQQIVIIDPKGDTWGIRSSANGKSPGLPVVILGGEHADVPLESNSGEIVAKLIVEERVSVLLDLSFFRKYEVAQFMAIFLETLYRLKAKEQYRTPVMLIIDEADAIGPQKPNKGEERMLGAAGDIVRRGGQRGIGCLLVTQRSAVLNKNLLTQSQIIVALRTIAPQDIAALDAWIEVHGSDEERETLLESIASLPIGDAWFWSPGWPHEKGIFKRVHVLPITTFDSGATPKPGEKRIQPKNLADVDLNALKRQMAATIEKAKADDPKELRKQIAELQRQLKQRPAQERIREEIPVEVKVPVVRDEDWKRFERLFQAIYNHGNEAIVAAKEIGVMLQTIRDCVSKFQRPVRQVVDPASLKAFPAPQPRVRVGKLVKVDVTRHNGPSNQEVDLSNPEEKILTVLAQRPEGITELERLAVLSGYTVNGHFTNVLGGLRSRGLITPPRVFPIQITDEGLTTLGSFEPLPTGVDLQRYWLNKLSTPEQRVWSVLLNHYPEPIELEQLASEAGYTVNGHFTNVVGNLRTKGLMTPARLPIRASDHLFQD